MFERFCKNHLVNWFDTHDPVAIAGQLLILIFLFLLAVGGTGAILYALFWEGNVIAWSLMTLLAVIFGISTLISRCIRKHAPKRGDDMYGSRGWD